MFCKKCGNKIPDGHKFCTECGAKIDEQQEQNNTHEYKTDYSEYTGRYEYRSPHNEPKFTFEQMSSHGSSQPIFGKSRIVAGLLAILTNFGIYNFYLGYFKKATIQLIITIISIAASFSASLLLQNHGPNLAYNICYLIYLVSALSVSIWGLVDAIRLFTKKLNKDGSGNPII